MIPVMVRSHYYKGLLVVVKRDRFIDPRERELMIQIGKTLDFDRRFCEATIDELLSNPHITRSPIIFHDEHIKECFFRDALRVALVDGDFHPAELSWLRKMAHANGESNQWLENIIREFRENNDAQQQCATLQIQKYM